MVNLNAQKKTKQNYITFSLPIKKDGTLITYELKVIDSFRFISTSISNLINNLSKKLQE